MGWEEEQVKQAKPASDATGRAEAAARAKEEALVRAMETIKNVFKTTANNFGATLVDASSPTEQSLASGGRSFVVRRDHDIIRIEVDGTPDRSELIFNAAYSWKIALQPEPTVLPWQPTIRLSEGDRLALKGEVNVRDYVGNYVTWWVKKHGIRHT